MTSVISHDVSGTAFQNGATNFCADTLHILFELCGVACNDEGSHTVEMGQTLFNRLNEWNLIDKFSPSDPYQFNGIPVVVNLTFRSEDIQNVRIYDKNNTLVGVLTVRER